MPNKKRKRVRIQIQIAMAITTPSFFAKWVKEAFIIYNIFL